jgi:hypothetical protein
MEDTNTHNSHATLGDTRGKRQVSNGEMLVSGLDESWRGILLGIGPDKRNVYWTMKTTTITFWNMTPCWAWRSIYGRSVRKSNTIQTIQLPMAHWSTCFAMIVIIKKKDIQHIMFIVYLVRPCRMRSWQRWRVKNSKRRTTRTTATPTIRSNETNKPKTAIVHAVDILIIHGKGTWWGFHYHVVWNNYWWYADEVLFLETIIVATSKQ